ncbi:SOS response-associated peptidase [Nesterenkonia suensis]
MCGRYVMALRAGELVDALESCGMEEVSPCGEIPDDDAQPWRPSWNVAPTSTVPILVERYEEDASRSRRREVHAARWGLLPRWAESAAFSSKTFNARSETVVSKPSFRSAVRRRRCAVPVQGYYEWRVTQAEGSSKPMRTPFFVQDAHAPLILFAGLYEWWKDPQRAAEGQDAWVLSATILTGPSPEPAAEDDGGSAPGDAVLTELAGLHDRLPLAMSARAAAEWIVPGERSKEEMEAAVESLRLEAVQVARGWRIHEVDRAVGNVRHDSPELIRPVGTMF